MRRRFVAFVHGPLERIGEEGGRREATRSLPIERAFEDLFDPPRHRGLRVFQRRDRLVEHLVERVGLAVALEESAPFERLPEDDAGSEHVSPAVDVLRGARLLGRHVRELALELTGAGRRELARCPRHAEIGEPRAAVDADEDVLRRDVAVHDAERLAVIVGQLVGGVQPREHVADDARRDAHGHAPPGLHRARNEVREGVALHVLHDDVVALVTRADLENGHDVRVMNPGRQPRLFEEHLDELGLACQVRMQPLDPDEALETAGTGDAAEEDGRHSAGRELRHQLEAVEPSGLAFDGNERDGQGFGSRAKVMASV